MWRDDALLLDMLLSARDARQFNEGKTWESFASDKLLQYATQHALQTIGEAASRVTAELQSAHAEIPWQKIIAFRHRLVHDYPRIELPKVWTIVQDHVPALIAALEPLVPPDDGDDG